MFHHIRNNTTVRFLWGFMALYFLNISVDTVDPYPNYIAEDLSFNDQESIVEIIVEQVLGFENAIEEHDDPDTEEHTEKNNLKIGFIPLYASNGNNRESIATVLKQICHHPDSNVSVGHHQLNNPPPEV
ncbi:hypothetical protein [Confluentibacter flavum]|uniref:Uncharacterized protein n=1 Tax=Confluentibacter flavum TaxID=1909700 RepID=A0A2N3HMU6_9FLAO|nr:hypothetical protein [Confluentibacter flavum]PKQ46158.1 hypothetical protein CSW08_03030 [Confluentibacter flavum]